MGSNPHYFDDILRKLLSAIPELKEAAIVSIEGLPIASMLPSNKDETRIAAMTAALLSLSERAVIEMEKGEFEQLYVKGNDGYLLVMQAGPNAVLTVSTTKDVRLGLIILDCKRTCEKIAKLISGQSGDSSNYGYVAPFPYIPPGPPGAAGDTKLKIIPSEMKIIPEPENFCKNCGAELPKGQSICHNCGKKVI